MMQPLLECYPCVIHQTIRMIRQIETDELKQQAMLRGMLEFLGKLEPVDTPPAIVQAMNRELMKRFGERDIYREVKQRFTSIALELVPKIKAHYLSGGDIRGKILQLAIAGNVIDLGAHWDMTEEKAFAFIEHAMALPFRGDVAGFYQAVDQAKRILYLGDNTGETVFDSLLLETLPCHKITYAVRGAPILNDAVMADALAAGLGDQVCVIDNGSDAPGTILGDCNKDFQTAFEQADLIISKGQGNYETLNTLQKNIYFLLNVKCRYVAEKIGCDVNALVMQKNTLFQKEELSCQEEIKADQTVMAP